MMVYAKNVLDEVNITRSDALVSTAFRTPAAQTATALYRNVGLSAERASAVSPAPPA